MENTTIAISNEIKDKIKEFGNKGETYSEIIARLLESARKRQLQDLLMNEENTVSIDEAIGNSKKPSSPLKCPISCLIITSASNFSLKTSACFRGT